MKGRSITYSTRGKKYPMYNRNMEGKSFVQILRRNCQLKQVIEGNIELGIDKKTGKKA